MKSGQFPVNLSQCQQTRGIQAMQKDDLNDKTSSEFLEVPWIVCKIPSKPCAIKRSSTSVLTFLHLLIKIPYWLILLAGKGIKRLLGR
ncbi:MAG: hypothetical protein WCP96_11440 [Methylococcaceae bacterium]